MVNKQLIEVPGCRAFGTGSEHCQPATVAFMIFAVVVTLAFAACFLLAAGLLALFFWRGRRSNTVEYSFKSVKFIAGIASLTCGGACLLVVGVISAFFGVLLLLGLVGFTISWLAALTVLIVCCVLLGISVYRGQYLVPYIVGPIIAPAVLGIEGIGAVSALIAADIINEVALIVIFVVCLVFNVFYVIVLLAFAGWSAYRDRKFEDGRIPWRWVWLGVSIFIALVILACVVVACFLALSVYTAIVSLTVVWLIEVGLAIACGVYFYIRPYFHLEQRLTKLAIAFISVTVAGITSVAWLCALMLRLLSYDVRV